MKRLLLKLAGLALCIIPPALATLFYFPVWISRGGEFVVSGLALILLILACLPLWRAVSHKLRSPALYTLWLIAFIAFSSLSKIADEMTVISFVGFIGNLIGAALFRLAKTEEMRNDAP